MDKDSSIVFLFIAVIMLLAVLSIVYKSWVNGISPMPTSASVRRAVLHELQRLRPSGKLVEAGSGWGTLALQIGRKYPGLRIIGIENSFIPMWISFLAAKMVKNHQVSFIMADLYTFNYVDVDTVVCYLHPAAMKRLSPLLQDQLKNGAHIVSICFALPGWEPVRVITCRDLYRTKVYLYRQAVD